MDNGSRKLACELIHPLLLRGICPFCKRSVLCKNSQESSGPNWNEEGVHAVLEHGRSWERAIVISSLQHGCSGSQGIALLCPLLTDLDRSVRSLATEALCVIGSQLSRKQVRSFESMCDDVTPSRSALATRILLLGAYQRAEWSDELAQQARRQHIVWVIKNFPQAEIAGLPETHFIPAQEIKAYAMARELWLSQSEKYPEDAMVQGNAAAFFDPWEKQVARKLMAKARSLEPENPYWSVPIV